jgi:DNA mismatch repair protein MutS2
MDSHTLTVLEYGEVLTHLASFTQSEPGRSLALSSTPCSRDSEVREKCALATEALKLLQASPPDLGRVSDIIPITERLRAEGVVLEPEQLLALLETQLAVRSAKKALRGMETEMPGLNSLAASMTGLPDWERWVRKALSDKGEVLDTASPELATARRRQRSAREEVIGRLERFIKGKAVSRVMQETYVTTRNGRYVVPAKPEYQRVFEGVVQDSSQSGQTLFIEPLFAIQLNNTNAEAEARVREEISRVLADLSREARRYRDTMATNMKTLAGMDLVLAKARLGGRLGGCLPELDPRETELRQARHPLLELDKNINCIPIDIGIGGEATTLVITGPNTGGKTVALKTLGLLTLMMQSGIPVPVGETSRMRVFERLFADIGDEQSLSQSLSTFSGHMKVIAGLLEMSDDRTLVLLDELGAGTEPQEGSALGISLLEALQKRGACVVATTHHNLLKDFAYRAPFARNASTVFDLRTLKPTFKLRMGAAGRSHALQVARRLGLDRRVIIRAQEIMGSGVVEVNELLGRLGEEVDREEAARRRAEEITGRLEVARIQQLSKQEKFREQVKEIRERTRRDARALLRDIEKKGKEIIKKIDEKDKEKTRVVLRNGIAAMEEEVVRRMPPTRAKKGGGHVKAGDEVQILSLGVLGQVGELAPGESEAEVFSGGIRMRVPVTDLAVTHTHEVHASNRPESIPIAYEVADGVPSEINLIGCTVSEALDSVQRLLDRSMLGPARSLRIVHGTGTGALMKAIGEALRSDSRVAAFGPAPLDQGGAGVTVVELKE